MTESIEPGRHSAGAAADATGQDVASGAGKDHADTALPPAEATADWLASLPPALRPRELLRVYPRIADRLAALWKRPALCAAYLGDLTHDRRGCRKGFPEAVARELSDLATHHATMYPIRLLQILRFPGILARISAEIFVRRAG